MTTARLLPGRALAPALALATAFAAALALAACGRSDEAAARSPGGNGPGAQARGPGGGGLFGGPERAIPVAAQVAAPAELQVTLRGSANLRAREQVEVLPKQSGVVAALRVEEGDRVRADQVLALLDDEEWRLQARQTEARAQASADAAQRARALQAQGLVSDQEAERLASEAEVAAADRDLALLRVRNAEIRSPIAGVVTHRYIERGQMVSSNTPAFAVADADRLELQVGIPEREALRVEVGQPARLRLDGAGSVVQGRVARIRPVVDPGSGTVQVTVEVSADADSRLRPGQFVNVDIVTERLDERLTLPRTAVLVDGAAPRIFLVSGGRAVERDVTLGLSQGDRVEITSGLEPGDTVVVVGQANLRHDAPVLLMELDGAPVEAAPAATPATRPNTTPAAQRGGQQQRRRPDGGQGAGARP